MVNDDGDLSRREEDALARTMGSFAGSICFMCSENVKQFVKRSTGAFGRGLDRS